MNRTPNPATHPPLLLLVPTAASGAALVAAPATAPTTAPGTAPGPGPTTAPGTVLDVSLALPTTRRDGGGGEGAGGADPGDGHD